MLGNVADAGTLVVVATATLLLSLSFSCAKMPCHVAEAGFEPQFPGKYRSAVILMFCV